MKKHLPLTALLCLGIAVCVLPSYVLHEIKPVKKSDEPSLITLKVQPIADKLYSPTALTFPGNGDIWVTEQPGKIRVIKNGKLIEEPLLDLRSKMLKVNKGYEERGLLGICLHPQFKSNKKFYVFYSAASSQASDHKDVIAEYKLSPNSNQVDPNSGRIILSAEKPAGNHDGGCIQFGKDGYLYISFGDGGGQGDKHGDFGNGQSINTWLGKILRVDVNTASGYVVPKTNPFVDRKDAKPEIWAYGFRNPYRFSFDKASGQLFAGDVGQDLWEEVDIVTKGANYGWRLMEGTHCYNPASGCDIKGITMPITEYSHTEGISVIGGYVYNGAQLPVLKSKYVFADWVGKIFYLQKAGTKWLRGKITLQNIPANSKILGFGEDPAGEVYVLTNADTGPENANGGIYKLVKN
ncbi:PQQ-dependent sugar dehydrogenase [Mucilaginibacter sp.]|uniref:PQQ-dependent sugar dehydrogenase n=1 Tax=Mucilaginibacter sp. TaxID=1882438 RepID=UPI0025FAB6C5|nr:PQQ-dependent sugar dehydrogenase [Mucilaginibacter sp.]